MRFFRCKRQPERFSGCFAVGRVAGGRGFQAAFAAAVLNAAVLGCLGGEPAFESGGVADFQVGGLGGGGLGDDVGFAQHAVAEKMQAVALTSYIGGLVVKIAAGVAVNGDDFVLRHQTAALGGAAVEHVGNQGVAVLLFETTAQFGRRLGYPSSL